MSQNVGYAHVGDRAAIDAAGHWVCKDTCPHPEHSIAERDATIRLLRYELADALNAVARANARLGEMKAAMTDD